jgi:mRNA interferase MazF
MRVGAGMHGQARGAWRGVAFVSVMVVGRTGAVTAVLVTGTAGPTYTHIPLGADAGLTEYAESYANATDLHTIPKPRLHRRRGRLAGAEMASLERAARTYLGP